MSKEPIQLKVSPDDNEVAYLYLPSHPKKKSPGLVKKQIKLSGLIDGYKGPDIYLDFTSDQTIVGIEIC